MSNNSIIIAKQAVEGVSDPYWSLVKSLMEFEGPNDSTVFTDEISGNTITNNLGKLTTTSALTGLSSLLLPGTTGQNFTSVLATPTFTNTDFTFELVFSLNALGQTTFIDTRSGSSGSHLTVYYQSGSIRLFQRTDQVTCPVTLVVGQRYALAVTHQAGITRIWLDGVKIGERALYTDGYNIGRLSLGFSGVNSSGIMNGRIDHMRYTYGAARYTDTYVPDFNPYPKQ